MKNLLYLKDEQLKGFIEKIFVGYRETFNDSKKVLKKYNLGTAHHKALHLISFYDGITITQLLNKLNVTCLLYTSPSPRDVEESRMPSSA